MKTISQVIEKLKSGKSTGILQNQWNEFTTWLTYRDNNFWLETYAHIGHFDKHDLKSIERINEEIARFSLTAKYKA